MPAMPGVQIQSKGRPTDPALAGTPVIARVKSSQAIAIAPPTAAVEGRAKARSTVHDRLRRRPRPAAREPATPAVTGPRC